MPNEDELKKLISQRALIKRQITLFDKFLSSIEVDSIDDDLVEALELRAAKVESFQDTFSAVQIDIEFYAGQSDQHDLESDTVLENITSLVLRARSLIRRFNAARTVDCQPPSRQSGVNEPTQSRNIVESNIRLPTIQIPTFSGAYEDWLGFRDIFKSVIEANYELSNIQKFYYLKSSLSGDAAKLIHSVSPSNDNYVIAWDLLETRYENKPIIVSKHLKSIFDLPVINRECSASLSSMVDVVESNLRALGNLGEPIQHWDSLLIFILTNRLDNNSRKEWESRRVSNNGGSKISELLDMLKTRGRVLETMESSTTQMRNKNYSTPPINKHETIQKPNAYADNRYCNYCKRKGHTIYKCELLLKLQVIDRIKEIEKLNICKNCLREGRCAEFCRNKRCFKCNQPHHIMLHKSSEMVAAVSEVAMTPNTEVITMNAQSVLASNTCHMLLSTAQVIVYDDQNNKHCCRALLDSGSQSNFISERLAQQMNLKIKKTNIEIIGVNAATSNAYNETALTLQSTVYDFSERLECIIIPQITNNLPLVTFNKNQFVLPANIKLADPRYFVSSPIDILLGAEIFYQLLCPEQITFGKGNPIAQRTLLGWTLAGPISKMPPNKVVNCSVTLENLLTKYWETETFEDSKNLSKEETDCEEHFQMTHARDVTGRFVVRLPLNNNINKLGNSYNTAKLRFLSTERRLNRLPDLRALYNKFIDEYIKLKHMSPCDTKISNDHYYLPHHSVTKESNSTTKLRVVFDASCKTATGVSLNDAQMVGPVVQSDLFSILINFRLNKYALSADIKKMYRQVLVHPEDRNYQLILWRFNSADQISAYKLNTLTYGTSSAPYLATRCLLQLAKENMNLFPNESKIIQRDFYVDDLLTGFSSLEELKTVRANLEKILASAKFELHKIKTNAPGMNEGDESHSMNFANPGPKTLGLNWNVKSDMLYCTLNAANLKIKATKRNILAATATLFDPIGYLSPITIIARILIQKLWKLNLNWDDTIPKSLEGEWNELSKQLPIVPELKIPRFILLEHYTKVQLHGFCDASELAYAACVYIRVTSKNNVTSKLLTSKSKIAPVKNVTLPRLELSAAVLLAKLIHRIRKIICIEIDNVYLWSDSTITLTWLKSTPSKWKTYVANRVSTIQSKTKINEWRYVPSKKNPADIVTRGQYPAKLKENKLWWNGPEYLKQSEDQWPVRDIIIQAIPELKRICSVVNNARAADTQKRFEEVFYQFSSYKKLLRVLAYCLRVKNKIRGALTVDELLTTEHRVLKRVQQDMFSSEIKALEKGQDLSANTRLKNLSPFLDKDGVLRVGGRLQNLDANYSFKHQILLLPDHVITKLIATNLHIKLCHCGPQSLLYALRERYWIISGRNFVRKIYHQCVLCFRTNPRNITPPMGNLPSDRITQVKPFEISGTDFAGPFHVRDRLGRGRQYYKVYVCIFVCFVTKAIHIELVSDLTSDAFIATLRRFVARRGKPAKIYSDNGTNYVGAKNQLEQLYEFIKLEQNQSDIQSGALLEEITWQFLPPRSPHLGGLWEAGVKSIKIHLVKVLGEAKLTYEQLLTVLSQIEAVLNSRPLSTINNNPNDPTPLTPGHFLIGRPLVAIADPNLDHLKTNKLSAYQHLQKLIREFWVRWHKEHLNELQPTKRSRNPMNIEKGMIVVLKEDNLPPLQWKLGIVVEVHPGNDSITRVATVRLPNGSTTKRAVKKLCPLPNGMTNSNDEA